MSSGPGQSTERGTPTNSFTDEPALEYIANDMENAGELYQVIHMLQPNTKVNGISGKFSKMTKRTRNIILHS